MLRSDVCDYSDEYIAVKGRRSVTGNNVVNRRNKKLTFQNNASFRSCISKFNNTFIDNVEDLDVVMTMHNLLECSSNYSMTQGSLQNYYGDEVNDSANENNAVNNFRINNRKSITSKSFEEVHQINRKYTKW